MRCSDRELFTVDKSPLQYPLTKKLLCLEAVIDLLRNSPIKDQCMISMHGLCVCMYDICESVVVETAQKNSVGVQKLKMVRAAVSGASGILMDRDELRMEDWRKDQRRDDCELTQGSLENIGLVFFLRDPSRKEIIPL